MSPRKQSVQRSSIQERISYDKVSYTATYGSYSPSAYDFKVPSTIHQRNDNSVELIDLTDDASESNTSSITTTQEELYSYLGVVTKSQTSKVETETENKTVKRSSLRVKVKQIALRNQEIYNQLENNRKLEAAAHAQSLVRYNGQRIEQASVQIRRNNGDPRLNQYSSKQQQSTYKSTTLVNNTTKSQPSRNNYRTVESNRVNQQRPQQQQQYPSNQLVPYPYKPPSRPRNSTNKCTVMERFVYKPQHQHQQQQPEPIPIQVNPDKYKTSVLTSNAANTTAVNRITNGTAHTVSRATKTAKVSPTRKPETIPPRDNRPPQITPGIKRKAMEQWLQLTTVHPTATNKVPSKAASSSSSSSSFTSFHQQNMTTTTNISSHRKIQKVDVSTVQTHYVKNVGASNTFQTVSSSNAGSGNFLPQKQIQNDPRQGHLLSRAVQNGGAVNALPLPKTMQQNSLTRNPSSPGGVNVINSASIQSPSLKPNRPSNALALQTCSQKNIGNNRVSKRRLSPKLSDEVKKAMIQEAHSLQNVVVKNVVTQRKIQNVNSNNVPTGKTYSLHNTDMGNNSSLKTSLQKQVSSSSSNNISPQKFSNFDARVSSSSMPVMRNIAVSNVSSLQTSSQQYISTNGNDVTIEVTVHSNFNTKRASSVQLRPLQNIETGNASSSEKNSQHNAANKNDMSRGNVKIVDPNKISQIQLMRPIQNIVTNAEPNISSNAGSISSIKNEQTTDSSKSTTMQLMQSHPMQNILLLPTSSMETKKTFQPPMFDIQSEVEISSKDLNENVADDNKPEIPIDLSISPIQHVPTAMRDTRTNSVDDVKPCLTITPMICEEVTVNESHCIESKSVEITENSNFLQKSDGDVLSVLSIDDQFAVIQEMIISFWTLPCELFSIFGVDQRYECVGKIERYNCGKLLQL